MKNPASLLLALCTTLAVAAEQPADPRPERGPEPRGERRPEGQPQGNQPVVIPLPQGLPPGAYMLVPLPSQPGQPQLGRGPNLERPDAERGNAQPREGQRNASRGAFAGLTPDEQAKLKAAVEKAGQEAAVKEAREVAQKAQKALEEARLNERKATEAAALKADPSLEPVFDKIHRAQQDQRPNARGNEGGDQSRAPRLEQPGR